jgi:rhodanese-related sulfurtransferase
VIQQVDRAEVQRLVTTHHATLVEVLPRRAYEQEHLAGAISIPLAELGREASARLRPDRAIVVYCHDGL